MMRLRLAVLTALSAVATALPAHADKGDPQGWSIQTDPRKRAYLRFVEEPDGPRVLLLACQRDTNVLGIYSAGLVEGVARSAMMSLQNGKAKYGLRGQTGVDDATGYPVFAYQTDLDPKALQFLQAELMPILQGKGPILITIGEVKHQVPVTGLAAPLKQFTAICFGR